MSDAFLFIVTWTLFPMMTTRDRSTLSLRRHHIATRDPAKILFVVLLVQSFIVAHKSLIVDLLLLRTRRRTVKYRCNRFPIYCPARHIPTPYQSARLTTTKYQCRMDTVIRQVASIYWRHMMHVTSRMSDQDLIGSPQFLPPGRRIPTLPLPMRKSMLKV